MKSKLNLTDSSRFPTQVSNELDSKFDDLSVFIIYCDVKCIKLDTLRKSSKEI